MFDREWVDEFEEGLDKLEAEGLFDGRLTDPDADYNFDMLAIINYCKTNNIEPETLTDEDLEKFTLKDRKPRNSSRYLHVPRYKRIFISPFWRKILGAGKILFPAGRPTV